MDLSVYVDGPAVTGFTSPTSAGVSSSLAPAGGWSILPPAPAPAPAPVVVDDLVALAASLNRAGSPLVYLEMA